MSQKALIVLTSADQMGSAGRKTGFYWEELAVPYWALVDAGLTVDFASVAGGEPPADPTSDGDDRPADVQRFMDDADAMAALKSTAAIDSVDASDYAVVFLPGGHGTMWDFAQTPAVGKAVASAYEAGAIVGSVCHGPAGLTEAYLSDGTPLVSGKRVNSFTNAEEEAVELTDVVPFSLETRLRERGALFERNPENFGPHAVRDGRLITGQNPASSQKVADLLVAALGDDQTAAA